MAQVSAADLGGKQVFLIDYAAAQPCTVECPAGSPGCPDPPPRYDPRNSVPLTPEKYELNWPSVWGGQNMTVRQQDHHQVYDGVIVRSPWRRNDPLFTHGAEGGEFLDQCAAADFGRPRHRRNEQDIHARRKVRSLRFVWRRRRVGRPRLERRLGHRRGSVDVLPAVSATATAISFSRSAATTFSDARRTSSTSALPIPAGSTASTPMDRSTTLNYDIDVVALNALATRAGRGTDRGEHSELEQLN